MVDAVTTYQWAIRFLHIVSGVMWVGGIALWSMLIAPTLDRRVPPQMGAPALGALTPRLGRYFTIAGVMTLVTGLWNFSFIVGGFGGIVDGFQTQPYGTLMGAAFVITVAMLLEGLFVATPAARKVGELARKNGGAAATPEMLALKKKLIIAGMMNLVMGFIALGLMAAAVKTRAG